VESGELLFGEFLYDCHHAIMEKLGIFEIYLFFSGEGKICGVGEGSFESTSEGDYISMTFGAVFVWP